MVEFRREPIEWYADKIDRGELFINLVYGDGEFQVAMGNPVGSRFTHYNEYITSQISGEMAHSLDITGEHIIKATDSSLINYMDYHGGDKESIRSAGRKIGAFLAGRKITWYDGTVWDWASRSGNLGPLLKALKKRNTILVGSPEFGSWGIFPVVPIPRENAVASLDEIEERILEKWGYSGEGRVVLLCMGIGAIPLAMRLMVLPGITVLDLGSSLDIFVGLGAERGWREEIYRDPTRLKQVIDKHMGGVC